MELSGSCRVACACVWERITERERERERIYLQKPFSTCKAVLTIPFSSPVWFFSSKDFSPFLGTLFSLENVILMNWKLHQLQHVCEREWERESERGECNHRSHSLNSELPVSVSKIPILWNKISLMYSEVPWIDDWLPQVKNNAPLVQMVRSYFWLAGVDLSDWSVPSDTEFKSHLVSNFALTLSSSKLGPKLCHCESSWEVSRTLKHIFRAWVRFMSSGESFGHKFYHWNAN